MEQSDSGGDTQSTATISDMDNDLDWDDCSARWPSLVKVRHEGTWRKVAEPETRFSVRQVEPGRGYQEANQADWELLPPLSTAWAVAPDEYHVLNEKSGQLIMADSVGILS